MFEQAIRAVAVFTKHVCIATIESIDNRLDNRPNMDEPLADAQYEYIYVADAAWMDDDE